MRSMLRMIIRIVICLVLAGGSYFLATGMMDSLYAYRSPLKDTPPVPGEKLGQPATRRLVFVLVDALRYDTAHNAEVMPNVAKLRQTGAVAQMHSRTPSFSEAGYSTLLTGAWPDMNDGPVMNLDYAEIPTWTQDNLFSAAARAGLKTAISGYYWFEKLVPQQAVTAHFYTPGEDAKADNDVLAAALPWLVDPKAYQLVLIHIDQVDYAGHHEGGPSGPNWNAAAKRADNQIGQILAQLDLSQDTIIVCSDHGQIDAGGHGGQDAVVLVEPFVLAGAGVRPGNYGNIQMVDVAPTLAALLGTNLPASAQGQAQVAMLALPEATLSAILAAQTAQQRQLVGAYQAAIGQKGPQPGGETVMDFQKALMAAHDARLAGDRLGRGILALMLLVGLIYLTYRGLNGGRGGWLAIGVVVYLLLFNLRYAVLDGMTYSFSSVKGSMDLILYCGITALIGMAGGWLVFALGGKLFRSTPGDAAVSTLNLALATAGVLSLPVLVHFFLNGLLVGWTLPEPLSYFLGLLSLIQILMVGIIGLLLAGVSALAARVNVRRNAPILERLSQVGK